MNSQHPELRREIRNHIYFFLIHLERDPPRSPRYGSIPVKYQVKDKRHAHGEGFSETVHYERGPLPLPYTSLSFTNRQIRAKVQEALTAVQNAGNLIYKIDLMVDDLDIYPTWVSVPAPTKHLTELKVDYRRVSDSFRSRWTGNGGPGSMTQTLARLLSRFIVHRPAFFGEADSEAETRFDVLTLRLIDTDFMDWRRCRISPEDFSGLTNCARLLRDYNILGWKTKLVRVQYDDRILEYKIQKRQVSDAHLAFWRRYWYGGPSPPR